ncbi:hypothetical protein D3C86_620000 [compost metagenome]
MCCLLAQVLHGALRLVLRGRLASVPSWFQYGMAPQVAPVGLLSWKSMPAVSKVERVRSASTITMPTVLRSWYRSMYESRSCQASAVRARMRPSAVSGTDRSTSARLWFQRP